MKKPLDVVNFGCFKIRFRVAGFLLQPYEFDHVWTYASPKLSTTMEVYTHFTMDMKSTAQQRAVDHLLDRQSARRGVAAFRWTKRTVPGLFLDLRNCSQKMLKSD